MQLYAKKQQSTYPSLGIHPTRHPGLGHSTAAKTLSIFAQQKRETEHRATCRGKEGKQGGRKSKIFQHTTTWH